MTLEEINQKALEYVKTFKVEGLLPALRAANQGAIKDVQDTSMTCYYQWSIGLIDLLKPKQIVELGGAMGVWDICVLWSLPETSKLYSVTLAEGGLEFSYVVDKYPNFIPCVGDDLDLTVWPKEIVLKDTDLWFFDSLHTEKQLRAELELYKQFFKKGAILLFDDIRMPELWGVWNELPYEKLEVTSPCHYSGFGIARI